jgi:hypothetical protein
MSEAEAAHARTTKEPSGSISIPLTVGAAVIAGAGILGTAYWLITFRWELFPSVGVVALGAYLLFTRATGADRA